MKRIGLLGGLGPEATLEYYKGIINAFKDDDLPLNYPEIVIFSVNMSEFLNMMINKEYGRLTDYIVDIIDKLKNAGASFVAMTANTPHLLFDRIQEKSSLPMVSIVESTCKEIIRHGLRKPALFGTGFTMNGTFYQDVFERNGLTVEIPDEQDKKTINEKLFSEIELGIFKDETRDLLLRIMDKMIQIRHIDSLILGCTEFPLILPDKKYSGIPMLNTTQIHINAIADYCRGIE